jgi:hypothetical protein
MSYDSGDVQKLASFLQAIPETDWPFARAWLANAIDAHDPVVGALVTLMLNGDVSIVDWHAEGGGPHLQLTEKGMQHVAELLIVNQEARDLLSTFTGRAIVSPSKEVM